MFKRIHPLGAVLVLVASVASAALAVADPDGLPAEPDRATAFDGLVGNYLAVQTALAADKIEGVAAAATAIRDIASALAESFDAATAGIAEKDSAVLMKTLPDLAQAAENLSLAGNIKDARAAFGAVSDAMITYRGLVSGA